MSGYQDALTRLADDTERQALALLAGDLDSDSLPGVLAALIARANARGHYLSETALAGYLARMLDVPPSEVAAGLPVAPQATDLDRLTGAAVVALAVPASAAVRVARLARAEPLQTAQAAMSRAMDERDEIAGWRREVEPEACEACQHFAGDAVLATSQPMWHHPGCVCTQQPVLREDTPR